MEGEPKSGVYDSNVTMLYRWANYFIVPIRFVIIQKMADNIVYSNLADLINDDIDAELTLLDVFTKYVDLSENISLDDISFLYLLVLRSKVDDVNLENKLNKVLMDINHIDIIRASISVTNIEDRGRINKIIRKIKENKTIEGTSRFDSPDKLDNAFNAWQEQVERDIQNDQVRLDSINRWHKILSQNENNAAIHTSINPTGSVIIIRPLYQGRLPNIDDGIDIFDQSRATYFTPFIQYNNQEGTKYFKILDSNLDLEKMNIASQIVRNNKINHLYITLWYQNVPNLPNDLTDPNVIRKTPTMFFKQVIYDIENNIIKIDMPNNTRSDIIFEEADVIYRLKAGLDCLSYNESKEAKTKGYFDVFNIKIDTASFLDMITNDDLFSSMLYVEERLRPISAKHQIVIHFREMFEDIGYNFTMLTETKEHIPIAEPNISLNVQTSKLDKFIQRKLHDGKIMSFKADTNVIRFVVNGGAPSTYISRMINVISVLLPIYDRSKDAIIKDYIAQLGEGSEYLLENINNRYERKLEDRDSDLVTSKKINIRDNFNIESNMYDPSRPKSFMIRKALGGIQRSRVLAVPAKTDMVLEYGQLAKLPRDISNTLDFVRDSVKVDRKRGVWEFHRAGTIRSPSSFLHAVCSAINYDKYINIDDISPTGGKEDLIRAIRTDISNTIHPSLLKQELFDLSEQHIREQIANPMIFLDPVVFYRAIEEYFLINIYVFGFDQNKSKNNRGNLIVPRSKLFHIHPPRYNRPTVIIYRHWGSDTSNLEYPQCEIIVDHTGENKKGNQTIKLFDANMTEHCHNILTMVTSNYTFLPSNNRRININELPPQIDPYLNIYNEVNYLTVLGIGLDKNGKSNLLYQYIDPNGKARAYTAIYNDNIKITFVTIPTSPENAPSSKEIERVSAVNLAKLMTKSIPTARSLNNLEQTDGIWFKLFNLQEGVYVPIQPEIQLPEVYQKLPIGSLNPLYTYQVGSQTEEYRLTLRISKFIKELIQWLYEVYRSDTIDPDPNYFCDKYLGIRNKRYKDINRNYTSLLKLPRRLPIVTGNDNISPIKEALIHIGKYSSVATSERFRFHDQKMLDSIREYVVKYDMIMSGSAPLIYDSIDAYYEYESDFTKHKSNLIFVGVNNMNRWINHIMTTKEKIFDLRMKLDLGISRLLEPRAYISPTNKMWLIQNSYGGSLEGSLAIAENWRKTFVNTGPHTPAIVQIPSHYIYAIGESGDLVAIEDNTDGSEQYLNIIKYSERRYGALLPLL